MPPPKSLARLFWTVLLDRVRAPSTRIAPPLPSLNPPVTVTPVMLTVVPESIRKTWLRPPAPIVTDVAAEPTMLIFEVTSIGPAVRLYMPGDTSTVSPLAAAATAARSVQFDDEQPEPGSAVLLTCQTLADAAAAPTARTNTALAALAITRTHSPFRLCT